MKYTTFRNSILAGGALAVVGGFFYFRAHAPAPKPTISPPVISERETVPEHLVSPRSPDNGKLGMRSGTADVAAPRPLVALPQASQAPTTGKAEKGAKIPLRELDRELMKLATQTQAAKASKGKDVFPGRPYKVNVYVEGDRVARAKVDLNRNNKWDEKWSFEPDGTIKRQVSPDDDDTNYMLSYKVAGESWVQK